MSLLQLSQRLSLKQKQQFASNELSFWASEFVTLEHGGPLSFVKHPYLIDVYQDRHPRLVFIKATQVGLSTFSALKVIHGCIYRYPLGAIYFFPTDSAISSFSRSRIAPLIENNPDSIGKYVEDTDAISLKKIGKSFLYLKGMGTRLAVLSVPADVIVMDELDSADPELMTMARKRLSASAFKEEVYLSNPSIPGYGIDLLFQDSDQKHWLLKCPHCGEWNCVDETFPDCLLKERGTVILACKKCRKELDKSKGEWVAKIPSNKTASGYRFSQLFSPTVSASEIYNEYTKAKVNGQLTVFFNMTLGRSYVTAREKLEPEAILAACSTEFPDDPFAGGGVSCGIDQGKNLHCTFKKRVGKKIFTWFIILTSFEDLDEYIEKCDRAVIDALPETRLARELAERFPGKVFLNFYVSGVKDAVKWDEDKMIVQENRTQALDAEHAMWVDGVNVLPPRSPEVEEFAQHISNVAKKIEEDPETGSKRWIWIHTGPDHFAHSDSYSLIALNEITETGGELNYV